jgi:hypothetical protein
MLKNIISAVFLTTIIASSTVSMAATTHEATSEHVTLAANIAHDENVLAQATNNSFQAEETSNVPSAAAGWTFAFALLGFVMLSNRRGV